MFESVMSEYGDYLRSRQLVKEGQVGSYVCWVRAFLAFASKEGIKDFDACLMRFLQDLESVHNKRPWELGQAKNAVHVYYYQFRRKGEKNEVCKPLRKTWGRTQVTIFLPVFYSLNKGLKQA